MDNAGPIKTAYGKYYVVLIMDDYSRHNLYLYALRSTFVVCSNHQSQPRVQPYILLYYTYLHILFTILDSLFASFKLQQIGHCAGLAKKRRHQSSSDCST